MNIIGIDVGGTKILGVRADQHGKIKSQLRWPTHGNEGLAAVLDRIALMIDELTPTEGVDAIGIGIPGPLDPAKGEVYNPPNLPGWETVPLSEEMYKRLEMNRDVPIELVNDANAAALAEFKFGAGSQERIAKAISHLVYLTISTGIGGGVISNRKLFLGSRGMAAELGHLVIDVNGTHCYCGGIGCLEAMASGTALAREASIVVASRRETLMAKMADDDPRNVTAQIVVEAARAGDPAALELMEQEGLLVGVGVVSCIHAFNPELVVLGGGVTNAGDLLFDAVRATVAARVMPGYKGSYEIVPAALGGESGALGAVAAALDAMDRGNTQRA